MECTGLRRARFPSRSCTISAALTRLGARNQRVVGAEVVGGGVGVKGPTFVWTDLEKAKENEEEEEEGNTRGWIGNIF